MTLAKHILHAVVAAIRKELTIQKPEPAAVQRQEVRQETSEDRILKRGLGGFAMIGIISLVMAILVF
jgi:hypothetical protein